MSEKRIRRSDARRNRAAILRAATEQLRRGREASMQEVAAAAGVSRSTLHRHFPTRAELEEALRSDALASARRAVERAGSGDAPLLAGLRRLVGALVELQSEYPVGVQEAAAVEELGATLLPLVEQLGRAAELSPELSGDFLRKAGAQLVHACLELGASKPPDPAGASDALFHALTDRLDRGLVILAVDGSPLATNPSAEALLAAAGGAERDRSSRYAWLETAYEDGSRCPADAYPLAVAVQTHQAQPATVRGHRAPGEDRLRWISVEGLVLREPGAGPVYAIVGVLSDVTEETEWKRRQLLPPGQLGEARPAPLDVVRALDEVPAHLFPEQLVSEAQRATGAPAALYVLDIDGSHLLRLAGAEAFPQRLDAPLALGPELAADGVPDLRARLLTELPEMGMVPLWLRGRAVGLLLTLRGAERSLTEIARHGAAAMELAGGYTDVFDAARRRKETAAAAELQQSLLPARIARMGAGELAGSILPSYEVGGDWFDYVENRDGAWIALADGAGKGATAGALSAIPLAALRAARRSDESLEAAARSMHEVTCEVSRPEFFVTAIVARWHPLHSTFSWINCGHPPPIVVRADGALAQLRTESNLPLGLMERERRFSRHQHRLEQGERLILHSDGITARRTDQGLFGLGGIERAVGNASSRSATATARAIQEAVMAASSDPLQDDAVVVVLSPSARDDSSPDLG